MCLMCSLTSCLFLSSTSFFSLPFCRPFHCQHICFCLSSFVTFFLYFYSPAFLLHLFIFSCSSLYLPSLPSSSCPSSIAVHTLTLVFLFSVPTSPGSQQWSAAHLQPRGGSRSHASGWARGSRCPPFPPSVPLPQPPHPPPHGDRLHGDNLHACHGTGQRRWWVRPKACLLPVSSPRRQQPHEPDLVPRGVHISLFKPRLFLLLQWSLATTPGRGHGRVIADWQPKYPIRGGRGGRRRGGSRALMEL